MKQGEKERIPLGQLAAHQNTQLDTYIVNVNINKVHIHSYH